MGTKPNPGPNPPEPEPGSNLQGVHLPLAELRWTLQCAREDLLALKYRYINRFKSKMGPAHWERWIDPFNQVVQEVNEMYAGEEDKFVPIVELKSTTLTSSIRGSLSFQEVPSEDVVDSAKLDAELDLAETEWGYGEDNDESPSEKVLRSRSMF